MEAIILQGISTFDFLTSAGPALSSKLTLSQGRERVLDSPSRPVPEVLNAAFFDILEGAYKTHLAKHHESFGLSKSSSKDRKAWATAFEKYWEDILAKLQPWMVNRKEEIKALRSDAIDHAQLEGILDQMTGRLSWISSGLFNSIEFGMEFPTPAPLLSPIFLTNMGKSITELKLWLELTWRWIDFFAMSKEAIQRSQGSSLSIISTLRRLEPVSTVSAQQVLWAIASEIFSMRFNGLIELRDKDTAAKSSPSLPTYQNLPMFGDRRPKAYFEIVSSGLKAWRAITQPGVIDSHPPQYCELPKDIKDNILGLPGGNVILNSLRLTSFPWAACPANQVSGRITAATHAALQALWLRDHQESTYSNIPAFWVLRTAVSDALEKYTSGFKGWWDKLEYPSEDEPEMPPSSQYPTSCSTRSLLSGQAKATDIQMGTESAVFDMVRILSSENAGGIPVPGDGGRMEIKLFEEVYDAAMKLFEAVAVASFRAQSVYLHPDQNHLAIIGKQKRRELVERLDISRAFQPAPFEVIETYLASFDAEHLGTLDVFGPRASIAFQKRKSLVDQKKKKQREQGASGSGDTTLVAQTPSTILVEDTPEQAKAPKKAKINEKKVIDFPTPPFDGLPDDVLVQVNLFGDGEEEVDAHEDIYEARMFADEEAEEVEEDSEVE